MKRREVVARGDIDDLQNDAAWAGMNLVSFDKTEAKLRNVGVTHGYRRVGLPLSVLWRSAFRWHNETLNVWTHLIPGLFFLLYFAPFLYFQRVFPSDGDTAMDRKLVTFYSMAAACTFLTSATYHLFGPYNLRVYAILHRADLAGIQLLITASYLPALHFAFRCFPLLHDLYLGITVMVFAVAVIALPILDSKGLATMRNLLFLAATAWGMIPTFHYLFLSGYAGRSFLHGVAEMYSCYAVGFFFFSSRYPERNLQGRFNFVGHSHQFWHISVALAAGLWLRSLLSFSDAMSPELCST